VIGNSEPDQRPPHPRPEFDPLWDAIEELGVPVGFHPTGQSSLPTTSRGATSIIPTGASSVWPAATRWS